MQPFVIHFINITNLCKLILSVYLSKYFVISRIFPEVNLGIFAFCDVLNVCFQQVTQVYCANQKQAMIF